MEGEGRWNALDGLRTVLVTGVMVHHMEWALGRVDPTAEAGWLPVDGFFVLSGFLIATVLQRELDATATIRVGRFLARRVARLVPALLVVLVAVGAISVVVDRRPWARTWPSLVSAATYVHNLNYLYGWLTPLLTEVGPLWSLSVEFQFYVLLPLALLGLHRAGTPRWLGAMVFATVAVASAAARGRAGFAGYPESFLFTPLRLDSLMWGVLVAVGWPVVVRVPAAVVRVAALGGGVALAALYVTASAYEDFTYRWGITAAGLASAAVVVGLLRQPTSGAGRLLATAPLVALGRRSYSAYLWHQPLFLLLARHTGLAGGAMFATGFAATWLAADVTYRAVERPTIAWAARRWRRPGPPPTAPPEAAAGAAGICWVMQWIPPPP